MVTVELAIGSSTMSVATSPCPARARSRDGSDTRHRDRDRERVLDGRGERGAQRARTTIVFTGNNGTASGIDFPNGTATRPALPCLLRRPTPIPLSASPSTRTRP
jgi:hypothetical protein